MAPIRPAPTRPWPWPGTCRAGSPASRSAPSTAAIIAGNPPEKRIERLREFWERVSSRLLAWPLSNDDNSRRVFNETSATLSAVGGVPGFFEPRVPPPVFQPQGTPEAISVYDTNPLKETLLELVDFDLLNSGAVRLSVGAVK